MKPFLRRADDADYWRFYGKPAPGWWVGLVGEDRHMLLGIGGVYLGTDGRFWCAFHKARGVNAKVMMHRAAVTVLGVLAEAGIKEAYALPDLTIAGSEFWLQRLGFAATDELFHSHKVWRWTPEQWR